MSRLPALGYLTAFFYILFTLLPNSHGLMVSWPWVFIWQMALACPVFWLLQQLWQNQPILFFGKGLTIALGLFLWNLAVNVVFATYRPQALWYGIVTLCFTATLCAVLHWLYGQPERLQRLARFQASLALAFILISLSLWTIQTLLPELSNLQVLNDAGIDKSFDWGNLNLRNWYPVGHQNYVAGYLVLVLPLLIGLGINSTGLLRGLWLGGSILGLVTLYTTSSRGGFLSLGSSICLFIIWLLNQPHSSRKLRWLAYGSLGSFLIFIFSNNRFFSFIHSLFSNSQNSEIAYRLITCITGWSMGISRPWTGLGLGAVPLDYQLYRPPWAGQEAELVLQLHSTPAQLWAEMGIGGLLVVIIFGSVLCHRVWQWHQNNLQSPAAAAPLSTQVLLYSLLFSLFGYSLYSLTDYQLDNICISGTLLIEFALLITITTPSSESSQPTFNQHLKKMVITGLALVTVIAGSWLIPAHQAWQLSSNGFQALQQNNFEQFQTQLSQAATKAPWEPYYPNQLAWNLGYTVAQDPSMEGSQTLINQSIEWFRQSLSIAPHQEFAASNLAWLLVKDQPQQATKLFLQAIHLVPAKKGLFFGLGYSLLRQNQPDLAIETWVFEILRNPILITSPIWQSPELASLYDPLLNRVKARLGELLESSQPENLNRYWYQIRGAINWWQGNLEAANNDWEKSGNSLLGKIMLNLENNNPAPALIQQLPNNSEKFALLAWLSPQQRSQYLTLAILSQPQLASAFQDSTLEQLVEDLSQSMTISPHFGTWLKVNAPSRNVQNQRLGFNILSRHIDGPTPSDFFPKVDNIPMTYFFERLLSSPVYNPELDNTIQKQHRDIIEQIKLL